MRAVVLYHDVGKLGKHDLPRFCLAEEIAPRAIVECDRHPALSGVIRHLAQIFHRKNIIFEKTYRLVAVHAHVENGASDIRGLVDLLLQHILDRSVDLTVLYRLRIPASDRKYRQLVFVDELFRLLDICDKRFRLVIVIRADLDKVKSVILRIAEKVLAVPSYHSEFHSRILRNSCFCPVSGHITVLW